jgi:hypothetical protein
MFPRTLNYVKKIRYLIISTFLIVFLFLYEFNSTSTSTSPLNNERHSSLSLSPSLIEIPELMYRPIYNDILNIDNFHKIPLNQRCEQYFQRLHKIQPNWWMSPKRGTEFNHDNLEKSQDLIHLNIYNYCFMNIQNGNPDSLKSFQNLENLFNGLDLKMYPYLSFKLPIFQHWTSKIFDTPEKLVNLNLDSNSIDLDSITPHSYQYNKIVTKKSNNNQPFWNFYKLNLKNTGIVISINDSLMNEALLLLKNLRIIENDLPIQFIHRGDLSNINKFKLTKIARDSLLNGPLQNIWFVDISQCLNTQYKDEFPKYFNKLLAYAFSSFENIILLDTDVVLFNSLSKLLKSSKFINHGTYFFKDRNLNMHMSDGFINFLKNTSPNKVDKYLFNINSINPKFWDIEYFMNKYFHYMESGVVLVNKSKYWNSVILSLQLSFIQSTIIGSWGDKEHFWMSMLLSGFDDFQFDDYWTASVGNIIHVGDDDNDIYKICSAHPAHVLSESNELMWINSGILNCPKSTPSTILEDFEAVENYNLGIKFETMENLENWYNLPINFDAFIIPPLSKFNIAQENFKDIKYSNLGLEQLPLCENYLWCAYNKIGDGSKPGWTGIFKNFTESQRKKYEFIAKEYIKGV